MHINWSDMGVRRVTKLCPQGLQVMQAANFRRTRYGPSDSYTKTQLSKLILQ